MHPYKILSSKTKDIFKQINLYLKVGDKIEIDKSEAGFFLSRLENRLKLWKEIFEKVELVNKENFLNYTTEWLKLMRCQQKIKIVSEEEVSRFLRGKIYDENKKFVYPYSTAIDFYNRLASIAHKMDIINEFLNKMYEVSIYSFYKKSIFLDQKISKHEKKTKEFYGKKYQPYYLPLTKRLDKFFFCACESLFYAFGGYMQSDNFILDGNVDSETYVKGLGYLIHAINAGLGAIYITDKVILITSEPKIRLQKQKDDTYIFHSEMGPAYKDINGVVKFYINGNEKDKNEIFIFNPKEFLKQSIGFKGQLVKKYGWEKIVEAVNYFVIDEIKSEYVTIQLIRADIEYYKLPETFLKISGPFGFGTRYYILPPGIKDILSALDEAFKDSSVFSI